MERIVFIWLDGKIIVGEHLGGQGPLVLAEPCELMAVTILRDISGGADIMIKRVLAPLGLRRLTIPDPERLAAFDVTLAPDTLDQYRKYRERISSVVLPGSGDRAQA